MGYSCTKAAADTLAFIEVSFRAPITPPTCVIRFGNADYFFERGREQSDWAITGTLQMVVNANREPCFDNAPDGKYCVPAGGVRIEPSGHITRFPRLPRKEKQRINRLVMEGCIPTNVRGHVSSL